MQDGTEIDGARVGVWLALASAAHFFLFIDQLLDLLPTQFIYSNEAFANQVMTANGIVIPHAGAEMRHTNKSNTTKPNTNT